MSDTGTTSHAPVLVVAAVEFRKSGLCPVRENHGGRGEQ